MIGLNSLDGLIYYNEIGKIMIKLLISNFSIENMLLSQKCFLSKN